MTAFLGLVFFGSGGAERMRFTTSSNFIPFVPFNLKSMAFGIKSLYLMAVCHFSTGIKSAKSKPLPSEEIMPTIYEHDVIGYIMRLSQQIQRTPALESQIELRLGTLSRIAFLAIGELSKLENKGNKEAAEMIYNHANMMANYFGELCDEKPELFIPFARKRLFWPGLISRHNPTIEANRKLMAKLELGADIKNIDRNGKWSLDAPEIEVALRLHGVIEVWREEQQPESIRRHKEMMKKLNKEFGRPANYRPPLPARKAPTKPEWEEEFRLHGESRKMAKNLPPFSKQTSAQWFNASWPFFLSRYGKEFQDKKCFARFIPIAQKSATKEGKKLRGILRRYIKQRILEAFKIIAPEVELKTQI